MVLAAAVTALALVVAGWTSGLRQVMHGALLALATAALLPFALIAGALLVIAAAGLVVASAGALGGAHDLSPDHVGWGLGEAVVEGGKRLIPRYYRFLARRRHPLFWGVAGGLLVGALLLWALIAVVVVPGEARTARALAAARADVEQSYATSGALPRPDDQGHLSIASGGARADGFGRPLQYQVSGRWKLASWKLTSLGFDGRPSSDDLCVSGSTKLFALADEAGITEHLAGVRALSCPRGSRP
jgi:hypothetical protein